MPLSEVEHMPKEVWAFNNQQRISDAWNFYQKQIQIDNALEYLRESYI